MEPNDQYGPLAGRPPIPVIYLRCTQLSRRDGRPTLMADDDAYAEKERPQTNIPNALMGSDAPNTLPLVSDEINDKVDVKSD